MAVTIVYVTLRVFVIGQYGVGGASQRYYSSVRADLLVVCV